MIEWLINRRKEYYALYKGNKLLGEVYGFYGYAPHLSYCGLYLHKDVFCATSSWPSLREVMNIVENKTNTYNVSQVPWKATGQCPDRIEKRYRQNHSTPRLQLPVYTKPLCIGGANLQDHHSAGSGWMGDQS